MGEQSASTELGGRKGHSGLFLTNLLLILILIAVFWHVTWPSIGRFTPEPGQTWEYIAFDTKTGQTCVSLPALASHVPKTLVSQGWPVCADLAKH